MDDDDINFDLEQCDDNEDRDLDWGFGLDGEKRLRPSKDFIRRHRNRS